MNENTNPRAVLGGNSPPDYAKLEAERLASEYVGYTNTLAELVGEADARDVAIPDDENADETALQNGALIKRFRDLDRRIEETRVVEVEPHLRRQNAANAFFKGLRKIISPEDPRERRTSPGWIDRLQARINAHQDRKEAKERARLEAERRERERVAEAARQEAARKLAEAEKAEREEAARKADAERARSPEKIEEKARVADDASKAAAGKVSEAVSASVLAEQATEAATDARIATLATSADLTRTRGVTAGGAGVTLTKAKEKYSIVVDRDQLDYVALGPHFSDDAVGVALNKFARATNYRTPMAGAEIGERTKGVTR